MSPAEASAEREIEAFMSARLGRPCLFLPSGRLALYLALVRCLSPGDRILMSPVTDDVIFFTVLAAGLRPVLAPVSPDDGNIAVDAVGERVWSDVAGVLTTNLYGLPDRVEELRARCDSLGIALIEDAAHAMETAVRGRPIGTFGDAAAFSLSKHVGAPCGGILAFADEDDRADLARLRDAMTTAGRRRDHLAQAGAHGAERLVVGSHLVWPVRWLRRRVGRPERDGYRMPLHPVALRRALADGPGLAPFDDWMRVDRHDFRMRPSMPLLALTLRRLRALDADRDRRVEGVARLRTVPVVAPAARRGDPQPLFRVPLLVEDRASLIARLERRIHGVGYIYDPPLDDYASPEFADPGPTHDVARNWARRALPIDPLESDQFLRAFSSGG